MATTLAGLYREPEIASHVYEALVDAGCDRHAISSVQPASGTHLATSELARMDYTHIPGVGEVRLRGPITDELRDAAHLPAGGLVDALTRRGLAQDDAHAYAEGVRRGDHLILAEVDPALVGKAQDILQRHGPIDTRARAAGWRERGWTGIAPGAPAYTAEERARLAEEERRRQDHVLGRGDRPTDIASGDWIGDPLSPRHDAPHRPGKGG